MQHKLQHESFTGADVFPVEKKTYFRIWSWRRSFSFLMGPLKL